MKHFRHNCVKLLFVASRMNVIVPLWAAPNGSFRGWISVLMALIASQIQI